MVRSQPATIHLPRSRFIALGGAAALAAGAGTLDVRVPARASLPPGWTTKQVGNVTQLLYNGSLVVSAGGIVNGDKSGTLTCWAPRGPALSTTIPTQMILGKPADMGNSYIWTPVSPGSMNYQSQYTQGNGSDNGNGTCTINDSKWGQLVAQTQRGGGGGGGHPREGVMGCVVATVGGEIGAVAWLGSVLAALEAAGWVAAAIPPMAMLALGLGACVAIAACLAAYVVCRES